MASEKSLHGEERWSEIPCLHGKQKVTDWACVARWKRDHLSVKSMDSTPAPHASTPLCTKPGCPLLGEMGRSLSARWRAKRRANGRSVSELSWAPELSGHSGAAALRLGLCFLQISKPQEQKKREKQRTQEVRTRHSPLPQKTWPFSTPKPTS